MKVWAIKPVIRASLFSAGVLLCTLPAHANNSEQLKSLQQDIAAQERQVRQQQQQRSVLLNQLKAQEQEIAAASSKLHETRNTLAVLNRQVTEMNASLPSYKNSRQLRNVIWQRS